MESTCICENSKNSRYEFVYEWWCKHQMFFKEEHNSDAESWDNETTEEEVVGQNEAMLELYDEEALLYWCGGSEYGAAFDETPLPYYYGPGQYEATIDPYGATPLPCCCVGTQQQGSRWYSSIGMEEYHRQTLLDHDCVASQYDPAPPPYYEPPRAYSI